MYFIRKQSLILFHHIPAMLGHNGALPQQAVAAGTTSGIHISRDGKHVPSLVQGQLRSDEGAAFGRGLHHHHAAGKAADDPVSPGKIPPIGRRAWRKLRHQAAPAGHIPVQIPVGAGVDHIEAVSQDPHHRLLRQKCPLHGQGIHTSCHAGHHQAAAFGNLVPHPAGRETAVSRGTPGPHHRHRRLCIKIRQSALII